MRCPIFWRRKDEVLLLVKLLKQQKNINHSFVRNYCDEQIVHYMFQSEWKNIFLGKKLIGSQNMFWVIYCVEIGLSLACY